METPSRYIRACISDELFVYFIDLNNTVYFRTETTLDDFEELFIEYICIDDNLEFPYVLDSSNKLIHLKDLKCKTPDELILKLTLMGAIDMPENSEDFNKDAEILKLNDEVKRLKKKISSFKNMFKTAVNDCD